MARMYHRGQVAALLRQLGRKPASTDHLRRKVENRPRQAGGKVNS
jgi:uncharacterized damage-inducible protein DinB